MRAADWQRWLDCLPSDPAGLEALEADLHRRIALAEARFRAAVWLGTNRVEERAARLEITELNSQLMAVQLRPAVAS